MFNCVWVVELVPKSVPDTSPVIPISSMMSNSQLITGTGMSRSLLVTLAAVTVDEITTSVLPAASEALTDVLLVLPAALTVTVYPRFCKRVCAALSPVFKVVEPTTSRALRG